MVTLGPVKNLNLRIENCEDVPNIQLLISSVKPDWPLDNLQYKVMFYSLSLISPSYSMKGRQMSFLLLVSIRPSLLIIAF